MYVESEALIINWPLSILVLESKFLKNRDWMQRDGVQGVALGQFLLSCYYSMTLLVLQLRHSHVVRALRVYCGHLGAVSMCTRCAAA